MQQQSAFRMPIEALCEFNLPPVSINFWMECEFSALTKTDWFTGEFFNGLITMTTSNIDGAP